MAHIELSYRKNCACKHGCDAYAEITQWSCGCVEVDIFHDAQRDDDCSDFSSLRRSCGKPGPPGFRREIFSPRPIAELKRPLSIFVSHASQDKPRVRELIAQLRCDELDFWLDEEKLVPGQDWQREIRSAIQKADIVMVCLSKTCVSKAGFVQREIRYALDAAEHQPDGALYLIPVRLDDCEIPESLHRWQWADLRDEDGVASVRRALEIRLSAQSPNS